VQPQVRQWTVRRTSAAPDWPTHRLLAAKAAAGATVSVVLPALNEEETVGAIVATIRAELMTGACPLVDEVLVLDSGSTDRTAAVAAAAGADVAHRDAVLPRIPAGAGKGEALWRSLHATAGDLVVFVDADLREFSADVVRGLLGPLLCDPGVHLVKGMYDRPLRGGETVLPAGGGRVTELVARPVLNLNWPELAGFVQPLAGEYAARRSLLERLPFPRGYGVELAILVDALALVGLDGLAQVDLGVRHHRHQDDAALGRMAAEVWHAALTRLRPDRPPGSRLTQFERTPDGLFHPVTADLACEERPPMRTVAEYARRRGLDRTA
jgi:glucosyl-3-phosphoglycerate synthase